MNSIKIVEKIITDPNVPLFYDSEIVSGHYIYFCFNDESGFKGLHIKTFDSEILPFSRPINCELIKNLISQYYSLSGIPTHIAITVFLILHELGHWYHFEELGMSKEEYKAKNNESTRPLERETIRMMRQATSEDEKKEIDRIYKTKYRELPFEKIADQYALDHFLDSIRALDL